MGTICPTNADVSKGVCGNVRGPAPSGFDGAHAGARRTRPVLLAIFVATTMTACGMGVWQEPVPGSEAARGRQG